MRGYCVVVAALAVFVGSGAVVGAQKDKNRQGVCSPCRLCIPETTRSEADSTSPWKSELRSPLYRLAESDKDAVFRVNAVSLDTSPSDNVPQGMSSAIAIVFLVAQQSGPDLYLTMSVLAVGGAVASTRVRRPCSPTSTSK